MANINSLRERRILDSRGEWTIEVELTTSGRQRVTASVPQGKSTGSYEAHYVSPEQAVRNVLKIIAPKLRNKNPLNQRQIDALLLKLDGTRNKRRLGANAMLGVSIACARAGAFVKAFRFGGIFVPLVLFDRILVCVGTFIRGSS